MNADQLIHKAALLMDLKGDAPKARAALQSAIEMADATCDLRAGVEARLFLAEVSLASGESQGVRELLSAAVTLANQVAEGDLVDQFVVRARELLTSLE